MVLNTGYFYQWLVPAKSSDKRCKLHTVEEHWNGKVCMYHLYHVQTAV